MEENLENKLPPINYSQREVMEVKAYTDKLQALLDHCEQIIIGQRELLELMLVCLLAEGHILLEGVPGIAKTLSAKVVAKTVDAAFSRIQFTPDLMPADVIGTSVYNLKDGQFEFRKGPIFSNLVLIDEINRAPAKTQSALFEVMEEKQISYDGVTYDMEFPFVIMATQNPIEQEGTYRLPEGQLDRFLMKIVMTYPSSSDELEILHKFKSRTGKIDLSSILKQIGPSEIKQLQEVVSKIYIEDQMVQYIVNMTQATRNHAKIYLGASPRASFALLKSAKVIALLNGRDFVIPDDIQYVAPHVYNHRLILTPDAELEGIDTYDVIEEIIKTLEVPR